MNCHSQFMATFFLIFLLLTACAGPIDQAAVTTSTSTPLNTPTSTTTGTPTNIPASIPTRTPASTPTAVRAAPQLVASESFQGVIFPAERMASGPQDEDAWTPLEGDILALEEQLPEYLAEVYPDLRRSLDTYTRQYWGTVTPDGSHAVYASFLCDAERMASFIDWRTAPVDVMDGGDCYFQTLYDVEKDVFVWLTINGES